MKLEAYIIGISLGSVFVGVTLTFIAKVYYLLSLKIDQKIDEFMQNIPLLEKIIDMLGALT